MIARRPNGLVDYLGNTVAVDQDQEGSLPDLTGYYPSGTIFLEPLEPKDDKNSSGSNYITLRISSIANLKIHSQLSVSQTSNRQRVKIKVYKIKTEQSKFYIEFIDESHAQTLVELGDTPSKPSSDEIELIHVVTGLIGFPEFTDRNIIAFTSSAGRGTLAFSSIDGNKFVITSTKARSEITAPTLQLSSYSDDEIISINDQIHNIEVDINEVKSSIDEINSATTSIYVSR